MKHRFGLFDFPLYSYKFPVVLFLEIAMKKLFICGGRKKNNSMKEVDVKWVTDPDKVSEDNLNSWFLNLPIDSKRQIFEKSVMGERIDKPCHQEQTEAADKENNEKEKAPSNGTVEEKPVTDNSGGILEPKIIEAGDSFPNIDGMEHTWEPCPGEMFRIRQPGYMDHKRKDFSGPAFYELLAMDTFRTSVHRESQLLPRKIKCFNHSTKSNHSDVPSVFVVNCILPSDPPSMFGNTDFDGPSMQIVFHFGITEQCKKWLEIYEQEGKDTPNVPPSLKLWVQWCKLAESDFDFRSRFKAIGLIDNLEDLNLPGLISKYNGKPALITNSGLLTRGDDFLEMDINVHRFAYIARKGFDLVKEKFEQGNIRMGFVVEAREEEHLPEQIIGAGFVKHFKRDRAAMFEDLYS